jgi:hypothetical protein
MQQGRALGELCRSACSRSRSRVTLTSVSLGPSGTPRFFDGAVAVFRSRSRLARGARLACSAAVAVSVLALVAFHAALFWSQIGSGRLLDPAVAVRWGLGALLLVALVALGRAGVPVLWGRRALIVWMLVALMHVTASPATDLVGITRPSAQTTQVLLDVPSAAAGLLFAATLSLLLLLGAHVAPPAVRAMRAGWIPSAGAETPILALHLASRAPPIVFA